MRLEDAGNRVGGTPVVYEDLDESGRDRRDREGRAPPRIMLRLLPMRSTSAPDGSTKTMRPRICAVTT